MCLVWRPAHLLLLVHALAHNVVDRRLDEAGADAFSVTVALLIVDDEAGIVSHVWLQLPHVLEHPRRLRTVRLRLRIALLVAVPDLQIHLQVVQSLLGYRDKSRLALRDQSS